jgi:hypothetical protein
VKDPEGDAELDDAQRRLGERLPGKGGASAAQDAPQVADHDPREERRQRHVRDDGFEVPVEDRSNEPLEPRVRRHQQAAEHQSHGHGQEQPEGDGDGEARLAVAGNGPPLDVLRREENPAEGRTEAGGDEPGHVVQHAAEPEIDAQQAGDRQREGEGHRQRVPRGEHRSVAPHQSEREEQGRDEEERELRGGGAPASPEHDGSHADERSDPEEEVDAPGGSPEEPVAQDSQGDRCAENDSGRAVGHCPLPMLRW